MQICEKIKLKRLSLGLTMEEIAVKLGYSGNSAISKIERGDMKITTDLLEKFADVFNVSPGWFFDYEDIPIIDISEETIPALNSSFPEQPTLKFSESEPQFRIVVEDLALEDLGIRRHDTVTFCARECQTFEELCEFVKKGDLVAVVRCTEKHVDYVLRLWFYDKENNLVILQASSARYTPIVCTPEDFKTSKYKVLGRAVSANINLEYRKFYGYNT